MKVKVTWDEFYPWFEPCDSRYSTELDADPEMYARLVALAKEAEEVQAYFSQLQRDKVVGPTY
jgi:hypothetical protein